MAACGSCGTENPEGYRFCGQCGSNLAVTSCSSCGRVNGLDQAFCGQCGASLLVTDTDSGAETNLSAQTHPFAESNSDADEPNQPERHDHDGLRDNRTAAEQVPAGLEERKLATVLFADVVGFTSLADRTDHEVVARMVDTAFRRLSEVVAEHGGTVDKYMGDSVMAVFGVPVAHDDDAERAVAAGLAMKELGGDLAFSIGINSGEVMATVVGRAGDFTVIGDTVNVAARLEKVASAGEVLCGRLTVDLASRAVVFSERGSVVLKGKREPVEVWEAAAMRYAVGAPEDGDARSGEPPLIGRADELAFLESQWRRVCRDRRAQVVLLCGDAGSGKTRLLKELVRRVEAEGIVVHAAYPAYGSMGGPRVAAEVIRQLGPVDDPEVNARVLSATGEIDPSLQSVDPAAIRQEQLWAFRRLLYEKSSKTPLLVVIDDMHRGGDQTLTLLSELAARLDDVPLMTLLVGRTEPADWLGRFPAATRVPLGALSNSDAKVLAGAFVGAKQLDAQTAQILVERAHGNPLYLRELVVMARERGLLVDDGESCRLVAPREVTGDVTGDAKGDLTGDVTVDAASQAALLASVPATLQALLAARLDALDPVHKLAVQHVAVVGEAASAEQVQALGTPEAATVLQALAAAGLLRQLDDGRYDTVDPLLREVAYEMLPRNARGELHRRAASTTSRSVEKARHLDRAAGYLVDDEVAASEAAEALAAAGEALIEMSRHLDAIGFLERAVALGCERTSALLALAQAQSLCNRAEDALETLARIPDDPADPSIAIERDHTAANSKTFTEPAWALPRLQEVAGRWHLLGVTEKEAWALANAGVALFYMSRMEEASTQLLSALALFEEIGDSNGRIATSSFLCLAKPADKRVSGWLADALEFAEQAGDRSREMTVLTTLAWHQFFRSFCGGAADMAAASKSARRMAELAEQLGASDLAIHGWSLLTFMERMSGDFEKASKCAAALERVARGMRPNDRWLAWAATFSVTVARGERGMTPPFPPDSASDPVTAMAALVVEAELILAGRAGESVGRFENTAHPDLGPIGDLGGIFYAIGLVVSGRGAEALAFAERTMRAAMALDAHSALNAAIALRAEITGDVRELGPPPEEAHSISELLALRAHAANGDPDAAASLKIGVEQLAMPGLAAGFSVG
jgi:class 3 adenylate cyclase/tetratricopeptide (TPR) repeat protein